MIETNYAEGGYQLICETAKKAGVTFGDAEAIKNAKGKIIIDVEENVFNEGDEFSVPADDAGFDKNFAEETFPNLTDSKGQPVKGNFLYVTVQNGGTSSYKRLRPNTGCKSQPEYKLDESNGCYLATGKVVNAGNDVYRELTALRTPYDRLAWFKGKKIRVARTIEVNQADRQGRKVVGVKKAFIPVFEEVK